MVKTDHIHNHNDHHLTPVSTKGELLAPENHICHHLLHPTTPRHDNDDPQPIQVPLASKIFPQDAAVEVNKVNDQEEERKGSQMVQQTAMNKPRKNAPEEKEET